MGIGPTKRYHIFCKALIVSNCKKHAQNVHRGAHGRLWVMGLEREESRRVVLSSGLCLES